MNISPINYSLKQEASNEGHIHKARQKSDLEQCGMLSLEGRLMLWAVDPDMFLKIQRTWILRSRIRFSEIVE